MPAALKIMNLASDENDTFSLAPEPDPSTLSPQHGQLDSPSPASPATADQFDCQSIQPGSFSDDSELPALVRKVRNHQQVDLTMLRLSFRKLMTPERPLNHPLEAELRDFTCSEFSNVVSAVTRIHDDERENLGIKPPVPTQDHDKNELARLEDLSLPELIDLCRQEGIVPPDTCQT
jgi:hypothetical protein